jgi:D-alanine-D-alanine ligase
MENIILIYGGRSGEHEVSLRSASYIFQNLKKAGYHPVPVGITKSGEWFMQDSVSPLSDKLPLVENEGNRVHLIPHRGFFLPGGKKIEALAVFPVLHGTYGEDGTIQGLLEMMDTPYVGANVQSSALAMDKISTKKVWESQNIPVVPYMTLTRGEKENRNFNSNSYYDRICHELGLPFFVKPSRAGSSVGVSQIKKKEDFLEALNRAFTYDREILIEQAIPAREIECSLIGSFTPEIFGPGEISPSHEFYDYEAKYIDPKGAALIIPAPLDEKLTKEIKDTAIKAYKALGINGLARVDLFLDKYTNIIYLNEVNTMPGFTSISMFPMLCVEDGLSGPLLVNKLIKSGITEYEEKKKLTFTL